IPPTDATVTALKGHAYPHESDTGEEQHNHVGIDTVNLDGKHYTGHVEEGQRVKAGDLLLEFDIAAIEKEGYKTITPVIVTNSDDYAGTQRVTGAVNACKDTLMTLKR
ncbi:MAG: PTS glucose transporter subunit IIA, partial [Agathobaculum sp.]